MQKMMHTEIDGVDAKTMHPCRHLRWDENASKIALFRRMRLISLPLHIKFTQETFREYNCPSTDRYRSHFLWCSDTLSPTLLLLLFVAVLFKSNVVIKIEHFLTSYESLIVEK